jgi:myb-related protein
MDKIMWTEEEDKILIEKIMSGIEKWAEIATFLNNRTSNSCRERWVNHLSPKINKEQWTTEEDDILLANQKKMGK